MLPESPKCVRYMQYMKISFQRAANWLWPIMHMHHGAVITRSYKRAILPTTEAMWIRGCMCNNPTLFQTLDDHHVQMRWTY